MIPERKIITDLRSGRFSSTFDVNEHRRVNYYSVVNSLRMSTWVVVSFTLIFSCVNASPTPAEEFVLVAPPLSEDVFIEYTFAVRWKKMSTPTVSEAVTLTPALFSAVRGAVFAAAHFDDTELASVTVEQPAEDVTVFLFQEMKGRPSGFWKVQNLNLTEFVVDGQVYRGRSWTERFWAATTTEFAFLVTYMWAIDAPGAVRSELIHEVQRLQAAQSESPPPLEDILIPPHGGYYVAAVRNTYNAARSAEYLSAHRDAAVTYHGKTYKYADYTLRPIVGGWKVGTAFHPSSSCGAGIWIAVRERGNLTEAEVLGLFVDVAVRELYVWVAAGPRQDDVLRHVKEVLGVGFQCFAGRPFHMDVTTEPIPLPMPTTLTPLPTPTWDLTLPPVQPPITALPPSTPVSFSVAYEVLAFYNANVSATAVGSMQLLATPLMRYSPSQVPRAKVERLDSSTVRITVYRSIMCGLIADLYVAFITQSHYVSDTHSLHTPVYVSKIDAAAAGVLGGVGGLDVVYGVVLTFSSSLHIYDAEYVVQGLEVSLADEGVADHVLSGTLIVHVAEHIVIMIGADEHTDTVKSAVDAIVARAVDTDHSDASLWVKSVEEKGIKYELTATYAQPLSDVGFVFLKNMFTTAAQRRGATKEHWRW